jgi:NADPH:quinone reductase-like Zn-dependent oxidoreductase
MNAIVYKKYGGPEVLHTEEVEKPDPRDNEVRVKVYAAGVNFGDLLAREFGHISPGTFNMPFLFWLLARISFGLGKPKHHVLGNEFSGVVDKTGAGVKKFTKGQTVFGYTGEKMGAYQEYLCIPEDGFLCDKPDEVGFPEAASGTMGALMALHLLKKSRLEPGKKVLIIGTSGSIGSGVLQLAKLRGAEVTGVCGTRRFEYVRGLGARRVMDYTQEDYTSGDETYDLIVDVLGKSGFSQCRKVLTPDGCYLRASFKMVHLIQMLLTSGRKGKKVRCVLAVPEPQDRETVRRYMEEKVMKSVVDRSFPMEEASAAHRYAEQGERRGPVVIIMAREIESEREGERNESPGV